MMFVTCAWELEILRKTDVGGECSPTWGSIFVHINQNDTWSIDNTGIERQKSTISHWVSSLPLCKQRQCSCD